MRKLDPHDPRPLYRQLADDLRNRIRQMDPGDPVPSLAGLRAEYDVSMQTVRRAVALIQQEGRIVRTRGKQFEVAETAGMNTVYVGPSAVLAARIATPADPA